MTETVHHPAHYGGDTVHEHIKVMESWLTPDQFVGYCRGCATKYLCRAEKKGSVEDNLAKAVFFINYEIRFRSHMEEAAAVKADDYDDTFLDNPAGYDGALSSEYVRCADCEIIVHRNSSHTYAGSLYCETCYNRVEDFEESLPK